jgi:molybdopterin molybdotransferase
MPGREFFATRTVADALAGFRPARTAGVEPAAVSGALRRVPARDVIATQALPGFARATVDGYAVRAADTYGSSEALPAYLDVVGAVAMGAPAAVEVTAGTAVAIPTGGALPVGADAVVMIEHTNETMPATVEVTRPVAAGDGVVRADEDVAPGDVLVRAGRPLRAQDLGVLAAAGVADIQVFARPRVTIVSTGDEVVSPTTAVLQPGQVRDATAWALAALVSDGGGEPVLAGIVADDATALQATLESALDGSDMVVVSAGSSVGARDETADVVARLGTVWCHGLAIKPGKPTLLAHCAGVPVIGLPGNPLSALVVFRMVGVPLMRQVGGYDVMPPEPVVATTLTRAIPSQAGRLDVVQVRLDAGMATPIFGASALLSVLSAADGYVVIPPEATGVDAGARVQVVVYL